MMENVLISKFDITILIITIIILEWFQYKAISSLF